MQLNELLSSKPDAERTLEEIVQPVNIPVPDQLAVGGALSLLTNSTDGPVPGNRSVSQMIAIVKPLIRRLLDDLNLLTLWVDCLIPKIEDGNNFGVDVQKEILAEIKAVETETRDYYEQIWWYFMVRTKAVAKVSKYPHIDDARQAVREIDERKLLLLWRSVADMRNMYVSLHDLVTKNLEKLMRPRSSNVESLY